MSEIIRYEGSGKMERDPEGFFVRHSDYADLERQIAELRAERARQGEVEHHLSNLLARIHRDGGHYEAEYGTAKAAGDADTIVANLYAAEAENARLRALPLKEEVERVAAKEIATKFFRWWWNKPGANTDEGFDEWAETEGEALLSRLRAGEQAVALPKDTSRFKSLSQADDELVASPPPSGEVEADAAPESQADERYPPEIGRGERLRCRAPSPPQTSALPFVFHRRPR